MPFSRRQFLGITLAALYTRTASAKDAETLGKLKLPAEHWRSQLSKDQYGVLFHEDTEPPFTHPYNQEKRAGTFLCAACYQPLFKSEMKFDSGTGWPSFWQTLPDAIGTKVDRQLWAERVEYHCARCGGHQGHVFDDGPKPTGKRYCNNGLALHFVPATEKLPALRN